MAGCIRVPDCKPRPKRSEADCRGWGMLKVHCWTSCGPWSKRWHCVKPTFLATGNPPWNTYTTHTHPHTHRLLQQTSMSRACIYNVWDKLHPNRWMTLYIDRFTCPQKRPKSTGQKGHGFRGLDIQNICSYFCRVRLILIGDGRELNSLCCYFTIRWQTVLSLCNFFSCGSNLWPQCPAHVCLPKLS